MWEMLVSQVAGNKSHKCVRPRDCWTGRPHRHAAGGFGEVESASSFPFFGYRLRVTFKVKQG